MLKPGVYEDIPHEDYLTKVEGLSASLLKLFRRSPAHYKAGLSCHRKETDALRIGTLVHLLTLEPDKAVSQTVVVPDLDYRIAANKHLRERIQRENPNKIMVKEDVWDSCCSLALAVRRHKGIAPYLKSSKKELTLVWERGDGILCKGRLDAYCEKSGVILDLKTTESADSRDFSQTIFRQGYHFQAAWYRDGLRALNLPFEGFILIAAEKSPPYGVRAYELDGEILSAASMQLDPILTRYKGCVEADSWPCYSEDIEVIDLPTWAKEI